MSYIGNEPTSVAFLTDTFSGNGSTTAFTLSAAPAGTSSILVSITGVVQDPTTYSTTGTTLTFSAAPPSGTSNISVRFLGIPASGVTTTAYRTVTEFTATAGQTSFSVPSYTVGYVDVYRNGVMLGSADYTATTGTTIVLASGATAGDLVEVISFYVSSVLNAIPGTAGSVGTTYLADSSVTTAKIAAGAVVQADIATGVAGTGPAFTAYPTTSQSISAATNTKVVLNAEEFDTNSNFNTSTYAFTPNVAGYYFVVGNVYSGATQREAILYKNGLFYKYLQNSTYGGGGSTNGSTLVYLNGTTDTIELYTYMNAGGTISGGLGQTNFGAFLARAA